MCGCPGVSYGQRPPYSHDMATRLDQWTRPTKCQQKGYVGIILCVHTENSSTNSSTNSVEDFVEEISSTKSSTEFVDEFVEEFVVRKLNGLLGSYFC